MSACQYDIEKIEAALLKVRPFVLQHGGDITFVRYQDGIVYVRLHGACIGCPISAMTLKMGVEQAIKQELPEILSVVQE